MTTTHATAERFSKPHISVGPKSKQHAAKEAHKTSVHLLAGACGGAMATIITCPLEVVRTRLQASHNKSALLGRSKGLWPGVLQSISIIYETEGLRGMWRGLVPALSGVIPSRAAQFATYSLMKSTLAPFLGQDTALHLVSGSLASAVSTTVSAPVWLVKTRMQLQTNKMICEGLAYKNSWDCVRRVYREEGASAFYKGLTASYLGMAGLAIQFSLYEKGKWFLLENTTRSKEQGLSPLEYLAVASASKGIASVITYPHEVLRTRFREQRSERRYKGIIQALQLIAREEGLAGLYGGLGPHLLKVIPNAAIMFLAYEWVVQMLSNPTE